MGKRQRKIERKKGRGVVKNVNIEKVEERQRKIERRGEGKGSREKLKHRKSGRRTEKNRKREKDEQ